MDGASAGAASRVRGGIADGLELSLEQVANAVAMV
jgi:hypothetical protein